MPPTPTKKKELHQFILDNPGLTISEIKYRFPAASGYTWKLIKQLKEERLLRVKDGRYFPDNAAISEIVHGLRYLYHNEEEEQKEKWRAILRPGLEYFHQRWLEVTTLIDFLEGKKLPKTNKRYTAEELNEIGSNLISWWSPKNAVK